jgi:hypothetical protein
MQSNTALKKSKKAQKDILPVVNKALILHPKVHKNMLTRIIKEETEKKAYELFLRNGGVHGNSLSHWLEAEKEVLGKYYWQLI